MRNKRNIYIIDAIIVLLNIAAGSGNYLKNWLLSTSNSYIFPAIIILLDIIYITIRPGRCGIKAFHSKNYILPSFVFVLLLFYCFINTLVKEGGLSLPAFEPMLIAFFLLYVLNKQALFIEKRKDNIKDRVVYLSRGYICLSLISIVGVICSFVLFKLHLVGDVPVSADFFSSNEESGVIYSRAFLSLHNVYVSSLGIMDVRVPFFQDDGVFCGLFHEGHILAYNVFPCLILLFGFYPKVNQRFIIVVTAIIMMLFSGSATNVLVVLACLSIYYLLLGRKNIFKMVLGVVAVLFAIMLYVSIDDTFFMFIIDRLDGSNVSNQHSQSLLKFAFTPKTLTGSNFLSTKFIKEGLKSGEDIGYIAFFMNIVFLLYYIRNIIKLIFKKDSIAVSVGFASLYFILHSAKFGMTMYMQILPIFLIFLQSYILSYYDREKTNK